MTSNTLVAFALIPLLAACGSTPRPVTPAAAEEPPASAAPVCATKEACEDEGDAAAQGGDKERAKKLFAAGCAMGGGGACVGLASLSKDQPEKMIELELKACSLGNAPGCLNAAELLRAGPRGKEAIDLYVKACTLPTGRGVSIRPMACGRGTRAAYEAKLYARAVDMSAIGCGPTVTTACDTLGVMVGNGDGVTKDLARAATLFERGCKGGDREACEHEKAVTAMADPLAVAGANLRMTSITADGFTLRDMACKVAGGGMEVMLAGPVLAAVLGKKKAVLGACAPGGADVAVRWTIAGHRVVDARAKANDDKKIEACVERVVKSSAGTFDATCRATIHIGAH